MLSRNQTLEADMRLYGRHLGRSTVRHDIISWNSLIWMKFVTPMQNHMPLTTERSRLKPEVQFQHGVHLFWKTGNSNISADNAQYHISKLLHLYIRRLDDVHVQAY